MGRVLHKFRTTLGGFNRRDVMNYIEGTDAEHRRQVAALEEELEKLRDEDPDCEVVCHFCHTKYHFDLNKLVEKAAYKTEPAAEQEPEA